MPTPLKSLAQGFGGNASDLFTTPYPHSLGDKARDAAGNEYLFVDFGAANMSIGSVVHITSANVANPLNTQALTGGTGGRIGVVVSANPTSAQAGWVQVYGFAMVQCDAGYGTAAGSATDVTDTSTRLIAATTVVTSPQGAITLMNIPSDPTSEGNVSTEIDEIIGMWPVQQGEATDIVNFSGDLSALINTVTGAAVTAVSETSGLGVSNTTVGISTNYIPVFLNYPFHLNQQVKSRSLPTS